MADGLPFDTGLTGSGALLFAFGLTWFILASDNADIEETRVDVYTKQVDAIVKQLEAGIPIGQDQMAALNQSIQLLDATQREEFNRRIQEALSQAQQLQPQV